MPVRTVGIILTAVLVFSRTLLAQGGGGVTTVTRGPAGQTLHATHPSGATVLAVTRGDSILTTRELTPDKEINAIVRFTSPPLGVYSSVRQPQKRAQLPSALAAIQGEHSQFRSDLSLLKGAPVRIRYEYTTALNGMALACTPEMLEAIRALPYVRSISEDGRVEALDDSSNAVIGAPSFWNAYGLTGDSVDIAIIDSGIDYLHEALGAAAFPNLKVVGGYDIVDNVPDPMDDNGHGTHVAGIAAGDGPPPQNLKGVAYKARLWAFKALDSHGSGLWSWVVEGIERAMDPDGNPLTPSPIEVINMSLGGSGNPDDPVAEAVDNAVDAGIVCAVAAGNWGPSYQSISTPGCARRALTVGATDNADSVAGFSSRGPSNDRYYLKPDVMAPGVNILSANMGGGYMAHSGTSMATPHVAGAAALLRQMHPDWTPEEIKALLMESAHDIGRDIWTQGSGRVDLMKAGAETFVVTPGSISFGLIDDTQPIWVSTASIMLHNHGSSEDSYQIATLSTPPAGVTVNLSTSSVTLAPGDSVSVSMTLSVDQSIFGYPGGNPPQVLNRITVTSSATQATYSIPFAFMKAPTLSLVVDEQPWWLMIHDNIHDFYFYTYPLPTPPETLRYILPPGTYDIIGEFFDFQKMILVENIQLSSSQYAYVSKAQSKNAVVYQARNPSGNEVSFLHTRGFLEIVQKDTRSGIIMFGTGLVKHNELDFPDVSSDYMVDVKQQVYESGIREYDQYSFGLQDGITSPVLLQNDPQQFSVVQYDASIPPGINAIYIFPSLEGISTGGIFSPLVLTPPFNWRAYFTPSPFPGYVFKYTTFLLSDGPSPITGGDRMIYCTGRVAVDQPDTVRFYNYAWHTTPVYSTTDNPVNSRVGYGVIRWSGQTGNTQTTIHLAPNVYDTWGNFISMQGDIAPGVLPYRLYSGGGAPLDSGSIEFPFQTMVPLDLTVSPGQYQCEVAFDRYKVLDTSGQALALLSFNTSAADKNPPFLKGFQIRANGKPAEFIPPQGGELCFVVSDSTAVDSVEVSYRALGGSEWYAAAVERRGGDSCIVPLVSLQTDGYTSLRIRATDPTGNSLVYNVEPAFIHRFFAFQPDTVWFGDVNLHETAERTFTVTNPLPSEVTISSVTTSDSDFTITPTACLIPGEASQLFTVSYYPRRAGFRTCMISFAHSALPQPTLYQIAGNGIDRRYRTFLPESLALARDPSGIARGVRQRPDKVEFQVSLRNNTGFASRLLHVEFDQALLGGSISVTPQAESAVHDSRGLKWDILLAQDLPHGQSVSLSGFGSKGRSIKIFRHWYVVAGIPQGAYSLPPQFTRNTPRLPMPNLNNVGEDIYRRAGSQALHVGILDGPKFIRHSTFKDVLATLYKRGLMHTHGPTCLDKFIRGTPILGNLRNLPPDRHNNLLLADQIALRTAITASDLALTPQGLGDLIYQDSAAGPLMGLTLREIASLADSFLILCTEPRPGVTAALLDSNLKVINGSFSGPVDTISFGALLQLTGARSLWTVPFMKFNHNASLVPLVRQPVNADGTPKEYALYQNYPNPFNPATTIRFSLPEPALVTIEVYDLLGQVVATPLKQESLEDGDHELVFNAAALASGIYFYRIRAEIIGEEGLNVKTFSQVRKMLLLK